MQTDLTEQLQNEVQTAIQSKQKLRLTGGGTKAFYGRQPEGQPLDVTEHRGIVHYEPTELVLTARAGTPLIEIEQALAEHQQMLAFEPPHFGPGATLGGAIASGLSGPRRPYSGSARDFVLGTRCLNGKGEVLTFGGQVMKNVAGFDASRLMVGAMGTLGVLLDVSIKVLPRPEHEISLSQTCNSAEAIKRMQTWAGRPLPLSAACHDGDQLIFRLSGSEDAVTDARKQLGGDPVADTDKFWQEIKNHRHSFFQDSTALWRLSVKPATPPISIVGEWFIDWGGAQRWLKTALNTRIIRETANRAGGHVTLFRGGDRISSVFHPLPAPLTILHQRLKKAFDPDGLFNHGRLYPDF